LSKKCVFYKATVECTFANSFFVTKKDKNEANDASTKHCKLLLHFHLKKDSTFFAKKDKISTKPVKLCLNDQKQNYFSTVKKQLYKT
jgi:hypothetical protein